MSKTRRIVTSAVVIVVAAAIALLVGSGMFGLSGEDAYAAPGNTPPAPAATSSSASAPGGAAASPSSESSSSSASANPPAASSSSATTPPAPAASSSSAAQAQDPNAGDASNVAMSLVFDVSGSMGDASAIAGLTKLASAKKQSSDFVSSVGGQQQNVPGGLSMRVGVVSFSNYATENCALSADPSVINASIDSLMPDSQTNMYAGLRAGIDQLLGEDGPRLMVFLSDGLSNVGGGSDDILALAREAASEDIKIYTIGFGASSDIDEDLLREIASITGGQYSHEDSSNISSAAVGLFATMMNARLQQASEVLMSTVGSVEQGATAQAGTFDITRNGTVQVYLYWPGSILDLNLTDPDGTLVEAGYPNVTIDTSTVPTSITIANAKQGTWNMGVFGREVSMTEEPYYAVAAFNAVAATGGAGAAPNNGEGLIFVVLAVAIACIGGVFAFTKRRSSDAV